MKAFDVIIYHNPFCGTSRDVINIVREIGIEPHIIEYLKTPPSALMLTILAKRAGIDLREFIRTKEEAYKKYSLDNIKLKNDEIANLMHKHPELINRPIVISLKGVKLCRPADSVLELLATQ